MGTQRARVFIIDDHPSIAELLRILLGWQTDLEFCGSATNARDALTSISIFSPDLVLLDLSLPDRHGLDLVKDICISHSKARVLVLSAHDEWFFAERALTAGARGYVTKSETSDLWLKAMRLVMAGSIYLSPAMTAHVKQQKEGYAACIRRLDHLSDRELEVFQLLGEGRSPGLISTELSLGLHTVETYQTRIRNKLGLSSTHELMRCAICWYVTGATPSRCAARHFPAVA